MAGSGVRRSYRVPFRIEPARGKVSEGSSKPNANEPCDVFQRNVFGLKNANGSGDVGPQVAVIIEPPPLTGRRERLTRKTAADQIDRLYLRPVLRFQVGQDRHVGPVAGEHRRRVRVRFAEPRRPGVEHFLYG